MRVRFLLPAPVHVAALAQLVERHFGRVKVFGSIPKGSSMIRVRLAVGRLVLSQKAEVRILDPEPVYDGVV